jgi:PIN domain nuclease of toxin-antitoxin system
MSDVAADTHTALWSLFDPGRLSPAASAALASVVQSGGGILLSAISLIEVLYLVEKNKLPATAYDGLLAAHLDPTDPIKLLPVDQHVALAVKQIPRAIVSDLPDRIIAATALAHGLPLITADQKIQAAPITTIW